MFQLDVVVLLILPQGGLEHLETLARQVSYQSEVVKEENLSPFHVYRSN